MVKGDAINAADVVAAAEGARFIVHGANPPMYKNWPKLVLPMLEGSIAAAKESGERILFPGSIYNFPADGPMVLREDTPQRATTRKGAIRITMERRLEAARSEGVRSLILRALSGSAGHRTFLGLSARCRRDNGADCRARRKPRRLRGVSFQGTLVRAGYRDR